MRLSAKYLELVKSNQSLNIYVYSQKGSSKIENQWSCTDILDLIYQKIVIAWPMISSISYRDVLQCLPLA
jgi:hypothetical protein